MKNRDVWPREVGGPETEDGYYLKENVMKHLILASLAVLLLFGMTSMAMAGKGNGPGDGTGTGICDGSNCQGECDCVCPDCPCDGDCDHPLCPCEGECCAEDAGYGPGDGTGNDHEGPQDGTGYGPGQPGGK